MPEALTLCERERSAGFAWQKGQLWQSDAIGPQSTMQLHPAGSSHLKRQEQKRQFQAAYDAMGGLGERVLGFSEIDLDPSLFPPGFPFSTENEPNFPMSEFR